MATSYKQFLVDRAPPFLRTPTGEAFLRAQGDVLDSLLYRAKDGVKARFPELAARDATAQLGGERGVPRGPTDTDDVYAERVLGAWDAWLWAGTAQGVLTVLRDAGYPGTELVIAKGLKYGLDSGTGELVITELGAGIPPTHWSAFFLYFPAASFPAGWAGTPPAIGTDEAQAIRALVSRWKSAQARFDRVVFDMGGPLWGLSTWGSFNWGGTAPVIWEGPF